ncbi:MAG: hypothetical protein BYD32DRAFT_179029 [Podila humilis]|nr:MAG: hypothetical protein BYD32DRAFT_179029 [Podila humilis]
MLARTCITYVAIIAVGLISMASAAPLTPLPRSSKPFLRHWVVPNSSPYPGTCSPCAASTESTSAAIPMLRLRTQDVISQLQIHPPIFFFLV